MGSPGFVQRQPAESWPWLGLAFAPGLALVAPGVEGPPLSPGWQPALQGKVAQAPGERGEGFSPNAIVV